MFWHFVTGNWFNSLLSYFICAFDERTLVTMMIRHQLRNCKNVLLFYLWFLNYSIYKGGHLEVSLNAYSQDVVSYKSGLVML